MTTNNYVWEKDISLNDLVLKQKEEIERLNKKIEQYENPEDMTLMFMWCDEKAKDEIKRLNNIINELEKSKEKQINDYEILILKIERYLNCYQYFLETQEENNKKIANMIHEFETKDSDKK